jgi:outer membrane lipoprotein carrier protein
MGLEARREMGARVAVGSRRKSWGWVLALAAGGALAWSPALTWADAPPKAAPSVDAATAVARRVQQFYDTTKTYRADFTQSYLVKVQNKKKTSKGQVAFEKPGKMSWKYAQPNGNRVVSDGKTVRVYEKDNEQMFESAVGKSQYPAALAFLMGQGKLEQDFTLRLLDASAMKFEGGVVLEAVPKDKTPAYQKMLLYVDTQTSQVRRVLMLDAQGNRNRFDFSSPVVNQPIPASEFTFTPPPGTRVIKP